MRKAHVVDDLLHLGLHPLLGETLQTAVEPDVLFHRQPAGGDVAPELAKSWTERGKQEQE